MGMVELEGVTRIVCLVLIVAGLIAAGVFAARVVVLCHRHGISFLKIEDKALAPESLQMALVLFATLIGGLWVVYTAAVSGTLELQQLTAERERRHQDPRITIDLQLDTLEAVSVGSGLLTPVHIQATVENKGVRQVKLTYRADPGKRQPPPLLLIGRVEPEKAGSIAKETILPLPYVSLGCPASKGCLPKVWSTGALESGGIGYYSFLHPGLAPGLYFVQFQLEVPKKDILPVGEFDPNDFVVWARAKYFEVLDPNVAAERKTAAASAKK